MKMFTMLLFSILFIPFISYSQNNINKKDVKDKNLVQSEGELKEDLEGRDEYFKIMSPPQSPNAYSEAVKQRESIASDKNSLSKTSATNWVSLSPNGEQKYVGRGYLSGRARAIAFDPTDSNIVYMASAGGGVWKTTNGGTNWSVLTDGLSSIASGDVLVDQRNPNIVYFGSGQLSYALGDGLFKSTDGGATWSHPADGVTMGKQCAQLSMDPVNSTILYWAGNSGILKSTNGGTNWTNVNSTTNATSIFVNSSAKIGTAVGGSGKIRRTTDGGATWTAQTSGVIDGLNGVYFVDANYGTVVGLNGRILRTTNGGSNWSIQTSGTTNGFKNVYFYSVNKGWTVGQNGTILYTTNGGTNWNAQTSGVPTIYLNGVSFSDSIKGTVVGASGTILRTTNGGTTWTAQTSGTTNSLMGVSFTDANNGTAVGVSGTILRTTNGGTNWTNQTSGTTNGLYGVSFYNSKIGQIVGLSGTILRTTNGGTNWTSQTSGITDNFMGSSFTDPMTGSATGANGKILRTIDCGITWTSQTSGETIQFQSIQFIYDNTKILMASFGLSSSTIKKSTDAGVTWTTLTNGLPSGSGIKRIQLAPYKNDNNIIYANIADALGTNTTGTYKTTDLGSSWSLTQSSVNYLYPQCTFNNSITVKPVSSNLVVAAGVHPYKSTDGGVNFSAIFAYDSVQYIHEDVHKLAYNGYTLYGCCDGGVWKSTNDGANWINLNKTLSTFQYYNADYVNIDNNKIRGGLQDNFSFHTSNGGASWFQDGAGDMGSNCFNQIDTNYSYAVSQYGSATRSLSPSYSPTYTITPQASTGGLFISPMKLAPGDNNTLFLGKQSLWKTSSAKTCDSYQGWSKIDSVTSGSGVYAIGISHTNANKFYYSYPSTIKATTNNGSTWTTATVSGSVWDIVVDNTNDNVAYACFNSGTNKVAKTTNGGVSWTYINGNLPASPYFSIVLRTSPSRMLFVAGDVGVFQSTDDGTTWVSFNSGLPVVRVMDLKYYQSSNKLMCSTHGRGLWMFDLSGLGKDMFAEVPKVYSLSENFPNPFNPQTHIQFSIPVPDNVMLTVYDVTGQEVETLVNNRLNAGNFEVTFDGSKYASGVYIYRLTVGNSFVDTKKMILLK